MTLVALVAAAMALRAQPARTGVSVTETKLTLKEAIEMALKSNLDLEIERTHIASAETAVKAARGAFDSIVRYAPGYEHRNTPTSSLLFGADGKLKESFNNHNLSYLHRLEKNGTALQLGFDNSRQTTSNPFVGLNPGWSSRLVFGVTQPLWRSRLTGRDRTEIVIRSRNVELSKLDLELRAIDIVTRVDLAYWDLAAARQNVTVTASGVEWAQEQLARTRRAIDAGTVARVEIAAAEAELERRKDTYYSALGGVTEAENALKILIASRRDESIWNDQIIPVDEKPAGDAAADDVTAAIRQAVEKRPELRSLSLRAENNETQKALARDELKPRVDLAANYALSGLAGAVPPSADNPFAQSNALTFTRLNELSRIAGLRPITPPSFGGAIPDALVGGYGSTLSNLFGGKYQTVQVGLSMDFNLGNRSAQAALDQTAITERRIKLERDRIEQAIAAQVRNAMQALDTARQRITAADASARAAKEKLDSETRLFQTGESTNFLVLTRQNEHLDSMRRAVVARLDYNRAIARLHAALGSTLEARGVGVK